jgi:hypothetical protein
VISLEYKPWALRGYKGQVWQVYVIIEDSHSLRDLIEVKTRLNSGEVYGLVLVENSSPAIRRLGWDSFADGVYYRYFV